MAVPLNSGTVTSEYIAYIFGAHREVRKVKRRFKRDYKPDPGSVIIVPRKKEEEKIDIVGLITMSLQIISTTITLIIAIDRVTKP